ncbi:unnamed protein product [Cuscuta campestris]|uniref:Uncharacterized protein n=1 Tax=Cuscuta campestris TaxID=132261 RepID=A0A484LYW1_9ASTE|nr:unnamed protein product [Cuscuta campestris]
MLPLIPRIHLIRMLPGQAKDVRPVEGLSEVYFSRMLLVKIIHHLVLNQNSRFMTRIKDLLGHLTVCNCLRQMVMDYLRISLQGMIHTMPILIRWKDVQGAGIGQIVVFGLHSNVMIIHKQVMNICHHRRLSLPMSKIQMKEASWK